MGREILKVPSEFQHPKDSAGAYVPGAHLPLLFALPQEQRTHFQMYETVSEGTPVSPIFASQHDLDRWFVDQRKKRQATLPHAIRTIPGSIGAEGREFMYIESAEDETLWMLVNRAFDARSVARPKHGGTMEERVRIKLKDGVSLSGISYNRDIEGWRAGFVGLCVATGRKYGIVKDGRLNLSTGESPLLDELEVIFEK